MPSERLPIYDIADRLRAEFARQRRLIVQAPTGSGKSTQIPQILLDAGLVPQGQIVILQPRRLAARMLARRVARERGVALGGEVGYQIRFHDASGPATRIKFVTEGILLRQTLGDPALRHVHTVIFDEFHERHLYGDVSLGQALRMQEALRPDLQLIVMSATLESAALARYLAPCATLRCAGRAHPIGIEYLDRPHDPLKVPVWDLAAREFERIIGRHPAGDVLVFMPGVYEITRTAERLRSLPAARGFLICPLHGELSEQDQDLAVAPHARRKVVVATNVAETSLTIEGIRLVIDSGLARVARFDPYRGINMLLTEKISRMSADQRAGRAGRTAPGHCLRLWTEQEDRHRPAAIVPEVKRVDLAEILLTLEAAAAATEAQRPPADIRSFPWLDPPDERALDRALSLLADLGALDAATGRITALGRRMVAFPMHPRFARMLLAAAEYGCVPAAALIAALTQERNLLTRSRDDLVTEQRDRKLGETTESDFFRLMQAWEYARAGGFSAEECQRLGIQGATARRVERIFRYFLGLAEEQNLLGDAGRAAVLPGTPQADEAVRKCILTGFSDQLACQAGTGSNRYLLPHGRTGALARESAVRNPPLLVAAEIRELESGKGNLRLVLSLCTAVELAWLRELFPGEFSESRVVSYDDDAKRVTGQRCTRFRELAVETRPDAAPDPEQAAKLLAAEVLAGRLTLKEWDHRVEQWVLRVNTLARHCPELGLPAVGEAERRALVERVCRGGLSYKDIKDQPVWPAVRALLAPEQHAALERHAPERLRLANGRTPALHYAADGPPHVALRVQELYGLTGAVRIAQGRVTVLFHVLAPNQRPVQITSDLSGFWEKDYPRVKNELQRKYPKHEWR